jgi:exopolyphosphatase/guanosine-5'-triphosphate,3'-diphosphate pyrophosphatase
MRLGVIDLGTNSVRFDVHQISRNGELTRLHREKLMVRLGQGAFLSRKLDREAVGRTLDAFARFRRVAVHLKTEKIIAFGTSALREVGDRDQLIELIRRSTGIHLRVITGAEEAQLIALGILSNEKLSASRIALVDIGGGSTEISICRGRKVLHSHSFNLGAARLQQVFLKKSPPTPQSVQELRDYIRAQLQSKMLQDNWPSVGRIVGSSGTIKALQKLTRKNQNSRKKNTIDRDRVHSLAVKMSVMGPAELLAIPGMEPKRVDLILAGAILFDEIMRQLGARKAQTTEYSLRDGIMEEELRLIERGTTSHLSIHLPEIFRLAEQFGRDPAHVRKTAKLAEDLFARFRGLHGLKQDWRAYLVAAAVLRNVGESINVVHAPRHSAYIIRNAELPVMEPWEIDMLAELCLSYKEGIKTGKGAKAKLPFKKDKGRRNAFIKLTALLGLLDALDGGPESSAKLRSTSVLKTRVQIRVSGRGVPGLESLPWDQRTLAFRRVFRKDISAVKSR